MYQETANRVNRPCGVLFFAQQPPSFLEEDRVICFLGAGLPVILVTRPSLTWARTPHFQKQISQNVGTNRSLSIDLFRSAGILGVNSEHCQSEIDLPEISRIDRGYNCSYTLGMKTAISIPDSLFEAADQLANRLGITRSELYRRAVRRFLETYSHQVIRETLDDVYGGSTDDSRLDTMIEYLQGGSLDRDDWS